MAGRINATLRRAAGMSLLDWCYVTIALKELFLARIRHTIQPTGKILSELQAGCPPDDAYAVKRPDAVDVACRSWAIGAAAARVPWRSDCLLQAMAANRWLRRDHLQTKFFLGVTKDKTGELRAHAWLNCGDFNVTGGRGEEFTTFNERQ